ncbi:MAG TPA: hypothetical protein VFX02_00355 [Gammaproteobacteria bacterium]|nr:hypothetical protein [Gammaproteobacteria bacterium]
MSAEENLPPIERLKHFKQKAEECYAKMYDCEPHNLKDWRDDACLYYAQAIRAAEELGLDSEKRAMEQRVEHLRGVFNQLRTDGGHVPTESKNKKRDYGPIWMWLLTWGYPIVLIVAVAAAFAYRFIHK